jgi:hypothetical protein
VIDAQTVGPELTTTRTREERGPNMKVKTHVKAGGVVFSD